MPLLGGGLAKLEENQDLGRTGSFHFDILKGGYETQQDLLCPHYKKGRALTPRPETKVWTGAHLLSSRPEPPALASRQVTPGLGWLNTCV